MQATTGIFRRSLDASEIGEYSDEDESSSSSTSCDTVDQEIQPPPKLALVRQESIFVSEEALAGLIGDLHMSPQPPRARSRAPSIVQQDAAQTSPLTILIKRLYATKKLKKVEDLAAEFSLEGRTILHYMAAEPKFDTYDKALATLCKHKAFTRLLVQKTKDDESPLHTMCQYQNAQMLDFILKSKKLKNADEVLRQSGIVKIKSTNSHAFLCLGRSLLDAKITQIYAVRMFDLLLSLYGQESAAILMKDLDSENCNFVGYTGQTKKEDLVAKATSIITGTFKQPPKRSSFSRLSSGFITINL